MKIIIHRGQHQIGGSIIEVRTETTKIIFDVGVNLDETAKTEYPIIKGLFEGEKGYDAVFISHYHADHMGLIDKVLEDIPVYIGKTAYRILQVSNQYRHIETEFCPLFLQHGKSILVGDIEVVPYSCDHSAYDSYMFLIKNNGRTILYTGDFRANGRLDYEKLLYELPEVDALIIEGTTLSRKEARDNILESALEEIAVEEARKYKGPCFVMMSAMNIERIATMRNVAKRTNRMLLEDVYTAQIATAIEKGKLKPDKDENIRVFITDGNPERYEQLKSFGSAKIGKQAIAKEKYVMCIRPSMINYLKKLNELQSFEDGILFYGMWKGYQEKEDIANLLQYLKERGVKIHTLHTSGHADEKTIEQLIADVNPSIIIPVHTENEEWFDVYKDIRWVVQDKNEIEI